MAIKKIILFLNKLFLKGSLAKRLIIYLTAGIILPLFLVLYFTYTGIFSNMVKQNAEKNQSNIIYLSKIFDSYFDDIKSIPDSFYNDRETFLAITNEVSNGYKYESNLYTKVINLYYSRRDIDTIRLYDSNGKRVNVISNGVESSFSLTSENEIKNFIPFLDKMYSTHGLYISPAGKKNNSGTDTFTVNQFITSIEGEKVLSILSMDVKSSFLDEQANELGLKTGESFFVFNDQFQPIYKNGKSATDSLLIDRIAGIIDTSADKGYTYADINNERRLIIYSWDSKHVYLLVESVLVKYINEDVQGFFLKDIFVLGLVILLLIIFIVIISNSILHPVKKLAESMKKLEGGKFDVQIDYNSNSSEISLLINKFNMMVGEINKLFNEKYKMEIAQKTAEFQALQAYINPHFLYNALQTVQYLALKRHAYEIDSIVMALGDMLKYCLRDKSNIVSLKEELEYVKRYLLIQKFKYVDNFEFYMNIDEASGMIKVPKLLLQPLIENCFIHGFSVEKSAFVISVDCKKTEAGFFAIDITDNGSGIKEDILNILENELDSSDENIKYNGDSIGIKNVNDRLKILYKNNATLKVSSVPYEKTIFTIKIPGESGELYEAFNNR